MNAVPNVDMITFLKENLNIAWHHNVYTLYKFNINKLQSHAEQSTLEYTSLADQNGKSFETSIQWEMKHPIVSSKKIPLG